MRRCAAQSEVSINQKLPNTKYRGEAEHIAPTRGVPHGFRPPPLKSRKLKSAVASADTKFAATASDRRM